MFPPLFRQKTVIFFTNFNNRKKYIAEKIFNNAQKLNGKHNNIKIEKLFSSLHLPVFAQRLFRTFLYSAQISGVVEKSYEPIRFNYAET